MENKHNRKKPSLTIDGEQQGECIILKKGELLRSSTCAPGAARVSSGRKERIKGAPADREEGGERHEEH